MKRFALGSICCSRHNMMHIVHCTNEWLRGVGVHVVESTTVFREMRYNFHNSLGKYNFKSSEFQQAFAVSVFKVTSIPLIAVELTF